MVNTIDRRRAIINRLGNLESTDFSTLCYFTLLTLSTPLLFVVPLTGNRFYIRPRDLEITQDHANRNGGPGSGALAYVKVLETKTKSPPKRKISNPSMQNEQIGSLKLFE